MVWIPTISCWLFTSYLISFGVSHVYGITLTARDETGIKGPNPVTVKCEYVLEPGETLFSLTMSRKRTTDPSYTDFAVFRPDVNSSLYGEGVLNTFKDRTTLILSDGSTSVRFDRVECEDEAAYRCTVTYQTAESRADIKTADMNLLLQAQPLTPTITLTPAYADGYTDGQQVQFRCQGSIGKPAGDFLWFRYRGNTPEDITSLARLNPSYPTTATCTFDRVSQLTLNVSRQDNGMTIRCAANHTTLTKPTGFETCNSTCRQTVKIAVFYTFTDSDPDVSSNPAGGTHTVGDTVTLKCNADTKPPATFSWHKEGDDNSTTPGGEWTLSNLQIEDSGTYTCMATNVVRGVTYNASRSLNINVFATTTTPSTTPSTSTQSPPSGKTDAVEPGPAGVSHVYGITLTARDETGIKGPNPVTVKCEYVLAPGEVLFTITMSRKRTTDPSYTEIAVFRPDVNSSLHGSGILNTFKLRTTLILSDGSTSVQFDRVECEDEAAYRCTVSYQTAGNTADTKTADMNLLLQAQPLTPTITLTPAYTDGYTDGQQVQFRCQGSVGKPAGDFLWFRYRGNMPGDITSLARLNPSYPTTGTCTFDRVSQLTLNVSRQDNGMTIRCAANHTTLTKPTGLDTCNSTCRQTDKIAVFYTFTESDPDVSSNPAGGTHTFGDTVTLKCNADTNPPATFSWHKEGDDNSTTPGGEWTLSNLQIEDSGTYTCMATNVVRGVTYNASRSLNINVVVKPIIPSTTITATSRGPPPGNTGVFQPETKDTDNTVVIVVCVIISVLLITGVLTGVVFYRKRRGMKTPEDAHYDKPYTALQRGTSVQQTYGVIRSETTQAPAQPRGFPVYVNESFDHAVGTTTTSVSRTAPAQPRGFPVYVNESFDHAVGTKTTSVSRTAPAQPGGFPVYVNKSFDHAVGTKTTSVSRTDGPIYEDLN